MQPDSIPKDLALYRIEQAKECLQGSERELAADAFKNAANRSYYCIFHAMRAVLALDSFDSKKHSGVISAFNRDYIKTGVFPVEFSKVIDSAFRVRNESDYENFYLVSKNKVVAQVESAKTFLDAAEKYVNGRIQNP
ncbi:hypothetical protein R80B4_02590 [Fibrobacteres bacterium R8-0-B4]